MKLCIAGERWISEAVEYHSKLIIIFELQNKMIDTNLFL